jgi:hypothetical protein
VQPTGPTQIKEIMSLFGQIIRTVVNTVVLPIAVVKDVVTIGGVVTGKSVSYTEEAIDTLKREAEE